MENNSRIHVENVRGDAIAVGVSGSHNTITKNQITINVHGGNLIVNQDDVSIDAKRIESLRVDIPDIKTPKEYEVTAALRQSIKNSKEIQKLMNRHISVLLDLEQSIHDKIGKRTQNIRVGEIQFSHDELLLKNTILTGNGYLYNEHINEALDVYNTVFAHRNPPVKTPEWETTLGYPNMDLASAWYNKGFALLSLDRSSDAIESFDMALGINPKHVYSLYLKGHLLIAKGRYNEAVQLIDKFLAQPANSCSSVALHNKGFALNRLGKYSEAMQCFDKSLAIDPSSYFTWFNRAKSYLYLEKYKDMIQSLDRALEIKPNYVEAWSEKGLALLYLRRYVEAMQCFEKALALNPNHDTAITNIGTILVNLGNYEEAIKCFNRALTINADKAEALIQKGNALNRLGRFTEAQLCWKRARQTSETQNHEATISVKNLHYEITCLNSLEFKMTGSCQESGETVRFNIVSNPHYGKLGPSQDPNFSNHVVYTPPIMGEWEDRFSYKATTTKGIDSNIATVTIKVKNIDMGKIGPFLGGGWVYPATFSVHQV